MPDLILDLRHLRYATLVAEHGSFRRAAAAVDLSQSTLSRRVQILERRLGIVLFERSRTGSRATPAGERFMRDAEIGAEYLRDAAWRMTASTKSGEGELKLGVVASFAQGPLADLLEAYREKFPCIAVRIEEAASQTNVSAVLRGHLDAAFILGEPIVSGCKARRLFDESLFVAVPAWHALATRSGVLWEDLRDETFLITAQAPGPEVEAIILRQLSGIGFRPNISVQGVGRENLLNMVGKGYGLTLAASSTLGTSYRGVAFVPLRSEKERVTWSAVWSASNPNPALKRMLQLSLNIFGRKGRSRSAGAAS